MSGIGINTRNILPATCVLSGIVNGLRVFVHYKFRPKVCAIIIIAEFRYSSHYIEPIRIGISRGQNITQTWKRYFLFLKNEPLYGTQRITGIAIPTP